MSSEIQENISPDKTNQITETELTSAKATKASVKRKKHPKKVAAGKRLAEHNRIIREALNRELKQESEEEAEVRDSSSWLPNTSFTTILSVVGIGLTIFDLYLRTRQKQRPKTLQSPRTENEIPEVVTKTQSQQQSKRFGME